MQYISRALYRDQALSAIREAILGGDLAPGAAIKDVALAERLGLSRTPVREALARLADEGLVESKPHSYTRVTPLDTAPVRDAHAVVQAMHALAVRLAVPRMGPTDLAAMRAANGRFATALAAGDVAAALAADDEFHDVAVRGSGNFAVVATIERYTPLVRRLERLRLATPPGRHSVAMHEEIIAACAVADAELAARLVERNWATLAELSEEDPHGAG
ncbi:DNA-binding GntR family transcriptional regulator [Saccharothrix tamanrassetensis]|uniref:DNA-binding GntR family transcriptional regulator n=1 Tax=Saccharothrix tamanrassetensis TaxID=1051531 RepID=A0A841CVE5_9PSEU|nr:GntR family transcriptional regulator [Saccharothrix tamanrassetensis]MBB5959925.1 DNA-binding GntR family transcriptional regulator [Saccharothrix tamanrassetensis]